MNASNIQHVVLTDSDFKKEWNDADFKSMNKALRRHFVGKTFKTMHNPEGVYVGSLKTLETVLGLPYTSSGVFACLNITNTDIPYDGEFKYEFFVLHDDGTAYAELWDKDENAIHIKL